MSCTVETSARRQRVRNSCGSGGVGGRGRWTQRLPRRVPGRRSMGVGGDVSCVYGSKRRPAYHTVAVADIGTVARSSAQSAEVSHDGVGVRCVFLFVVRVTNSPEVVRSASACVREALCGAVVPPPETWTWRVCALCSVEARRGSRRGRRRGHGQGPKERNRRAAPAGLLPPSGLLGLARDSTVTVAGRGGKTTST
jgi:hypothetical protein